MEWPRKHFLCVAVDFSFHLRRCWWISSECQRGSVEAHYLTRARRAQSSWRSTFTPTFCPKRGPIGNRYPPKTTTCFVHHCCVVIWSPKKTDNDSVFYGTLLILNVVGRFSIFEVTPDKSKFRKLRCSHLVDVATGGLRRLHFASVLNFIGPSSFAFRIRMILEEELQFRKKIVKLAPRGPATTSLKGVLEKRGSPI